MHISEVVKIALPTRPINLDNKIEDKKPKSGNRIIKSVILNLN